MELNVEYKRDLSHNYMLISDSSDPGADTYEIRTLMSNRIEGLLPMEIERVNGSVVYRYDITSFQPFSAFCESGRMTIIPFKKMYLGLLDSLLLFEDYLLDSRHLFLDPEHLYIRWEQAELQIPYVPFYSMDIRRSLILMTEMILTQISHEDQDAIILACRVMHELQRKDCQLTELRRVLENEAPGTEMPYSADASPDALYSKTDNSEEGLPDAAYMDTPYGRKKPYERENHNRRGSLSGETAGGSMYRGSTQENAGSRFPNGNGLYDHGSGNDDVGENTYRSEAFSDASYVSAPGRYPTPGGYSDGRDPYTDGRDPYTDGRDPYTDGRDPYTGGRDPYMEAADGGSVSSRNAGGRRRFAGSENRDNAAGPAAGRRRAKNGRPRNMDKKDFRGAGGTGRPSKQAGPGRGGAADRESGGLKFPGFGKKEVSEKNSRRNTGTADNPKRSGGTLGPGRKKTAESEVKKALGNQLPEKGTVRMALIAAIPAALLFVLLHVQNVLVLSTAEAAGIAFFVAAAILLILYLTEKTASKRRSAQDQSNSFHGEAFFREQSGGEAYREPYRGQSGGEAYREPYRGQPGGEAYREPYRGQSHREAYREPLPSYAAAGAAGDPGSFTPLYEKAEENAFIASLIPADNLSGLQEIRLHGREILIGKQKNLVNAVIPDDTVSRIHARIFRKNGMYFISDMGSKNGTTVDGEALIGRDEIPLTEGARICFSNCAYLYHEDHSGGIL